MELKLDQPQLFDSNGAPLVLSDDDIAQAVSSGKAGVLKGAEIPVISPDGTLGTVPAEKAAEAFSSGYKYEPLDSQTERAMAEKYGSGGQTVRAGAEGLARGLTIGLSDPLQVALGVDPEEIKQRQEQNPVVSTGAAIAGAAIPAVLSGGASAPGAIGSIARAAGLTPAAGVIRAGTAVTEAIAPSVTRLIGTEGAKSLAKRIAAGAIPAAAGSAVEGGLYGLGTAISEEALGDPQSIGEKIVSYVGVGALFGAGVGGAFGAIGGALLKPEAKALISEIDDVKPPRAPLTEEEQYLRYGGGATPPKPGESIVQALDEMGVPIEKQQSVIEGLTELKPNAKEIRAAAEILDAPVLESQVSASKHVQDWDSMLSQSPTTTGVARQQVFQKGYDRAEQVVGRSLGEGADMSAAEIGNALKQSVATRLEAERAPITQLYEELKLSTSAVPVSENSTASIARNIRKLEGVELSPSSAEAKLANNVADEIANLKTVDDIKRYKTILNRNAAPETRFIVRQISEKLDNLEENTVLRFAETMRTGKAKERIESLLDQHKVAKAGYKEFRGKMQELGNVIGKKKIYGPQDFLDYIEEITPEKFARRLFAKDNSEFLTFFNKNFPEETKLLMQYERAAIRNAAMKDGRLQVTQVIRQYDKLSPELKKIMFTDVERKMIEASKTYIEAMPKNINPSGTSKSEAYRRFFENPLSATAQSIKDKASLYTISKLVDKTGGAGAPQAKLLIRLEQLAQETSKNIKSSISAFVSGAKSKQVSIAIPASVNYLASTRLDGQNKERKKKSKEEFFARRYAEVSNIVSNPSMMSDNISKNLMGIRKTAPKVSEMMTSTAIRAAEFLYEKAPKNQNVQYSLSPSIKKWRPSDADIAKWERYVTAVDNPASVLTDLKNGTITREGIDVLKNVYPTMYSEVVQGIMESLTELKQDLPYQKRLQLSLFFDIPIDSATDPKFIAQMQASHAQAQQQEQQSKGINMSGMAKSEQASRLQSGTERLLNRGA